jgi:hypothetical protein
MQDIDDDVIDATDRDTDAKPKAGRSGSATTRAALVTTAAADPPMPKLVHPFRRFIERHSSGAFFEGDFIQVNGNTGEITRGSNKVPVGATEHFRANLHGAQEGWVKLVKGQPEERRLGLIVEGFEPPERWELGDMEKHLWDKNQDPWKPSCYLPLRDNAGALCCFSSMNVSGCDALSKLLEVYMRPGADRGGKCPVIRITTTSYFNKTYNRDVFKPLFEIVGWEYWDGQTPMPEIALIEVPAEPAIKKPAPRKLPRSDMDDEIPF